MRRTLTEAMIAPGTPDDVDVQPHPAEPYDDPTCGIALPQAPLIRPARHRMVVIGDSLSQGFKNGAVFDSHLSWPALVAGRLGVDPTRYQTRLETLGGLPFNLEHAARKLEPRFGSTISPHELGILAISLYRMLDQIEDYWERGDGARSAADVSVQARHDRTLNLSVFGFDLRDSMSYTAARADSLRLLPRRDNVRNQIVENAQAIMAAEVIGTASTREATRRTALSIKRALSTERADKSDRIAEAPQGIETLVVMLGSNNALGAVTQLRVQWSDDDYRDLDRKHRFTVWRPTHFESELRELESELDSIHARHVLVANIPHVTIAPLARGIGDAKYEPGSRYFPYYTRPWITSDNFSPANDAHLTSAQARAIDSAIDQYNRAIYDMVQRARRRGRDFRLLDICSILDRLAQRRYIDDPLARPHWWTPYVLPDAVASLSPVPDSRFFASDRTGRTAGGLFSLDGIHPTTIGYGILGNEVLRLMSKCGVRLESPPEIDFESLIRRDTLIALPPTNTSALMELLGWFDRVLDGLSRGLGKSRGIC